MLSCRRPPKNEPGKFAAWLVFYPFPPCHAILSKRLLEDAQYDIMDATSKTAGPTFDEVNL